MGYYLLAFYFDSWPADLDVRICVNFMHDVELYAGLRTNQLLDLNNKYNKLKDKLIQ